MEIVTAPRNGGSVVVMIPFARAARAFGVVATLLFPSVTASAQRPDFSGTWDRVADSVAARPSIAATGDAAFRKGDPGSGWGSPLKITQQPNRLVVEYEVFSAYDLQPPLQFSYTLDGSASVNSLMIGHAMSTLRSTAAWTDDALVIATTFPGPAGRDGRPIEVRVRQSLRLESPTRLVIETTRAGILGAAESTTRTAYTRR